MFNKKSSRPSLALFVALALGSGVFLAPSAASAADVNGQNVEIDDAHAPSNNAIDPGGGPAFGTAAGFIGNVSDSGHVTNNTLTFHPQSAPYGQHLFGGLTFGTGNATGNRIIVNSATLPLLSSVNGIYGGAANGGGSVQNNHAIFNGDHLNDDMVGGMTRTNGTGLVQGNTATLKGGSAHADIYGGMAVGGANGDVVGNTATIEGGTITGTGNVYGGYTDGTGKVTGNIVTIKGGIINGAYGGYSGGSGEVSGNTVNLGDGTGAMAAGYAINGTLFGGQNTTDPNKVSNNTLNVNTNAVAHNIKNFSTINFNFNAHTNAASSLLTLSDSAGTQIASLEQIHLSGAPLDKSEGTLIENTHGITLGAYSNAVSRTMEKTESIIDRDGTNKIGYKYYQFKESTEAKSDSTTIWGGRSILGNTTTGNEVTVSGNHLTRSAYGGLTSGTGSTATGENATTHSMNNKITLTGPSTNVHHMSGGMTLSAGGNATGNHAILNAGTVHGQIHGGSAVSGNATGNFVDINGGTVISITVGGAANGSGKSAKNIVKLTGGSALDVYGGHSHGGDTEGNSVEISGGTARSIYGGESDGTGKATENTVTLTGGTLSGDIFGGIAANGDAVKNHVNIEGGSTSGHDAYGGWSTNGNATGNTVNITGGSVRDVYGGRAASGNATKNIVSLANATVNSITGGEGATTNNNTVNLNGGANVTGALKGGSQANGTGNTLNIKGTNSAGSISGFQKLHFDTDGASTTTPLLNVTGGATNLDWNTLDASGTSVNRVSLLKNAAGINLSNHTPGTVKSKINEAGTTEYNIDVEKTGSTITDITYQGYQFKGKTTATTEGTDTYGGRSKAGNTTTENELTVDSGSHTNIYGGWTSGAGSTADAAKQKDSTNNKATVKGTAAAAGDVIGGLTEVAGGKATGNTVTIEKDLAATNIIGGKAASGEASDNTVNLANATVNSVTGGDGTTTNNNKVNLNGSAQVTGALKGGSQANGTGNTLNVKGKDNKAGTIANIQKMNFDATGLAKGDTMLEATGAGTTTVDWTNLKASGTAVKPLTLFKNANGINLTGYTGAAKSETGETTETNIDVRKSGSTVTEITYEGYQFKGVTQAATVTEGAVTDTFGGRSKAGNSTRENTVEVASGTHTNVYGGWTSGSGSTATDKDTSYKNTVTVKGSANVTNTLYGGYTEAAGGKATENTVTVEKDLVTANIIGGKAAAEASNNTVNLSNTTINAVTGGDGATTNNNIVNLKGNAQVTGALKGGTAANGTGNTLNVTGKNNKAGSISGFQKLTFDTTNADANPMLQVTGGAATDVDWANLTATGAASETPKTLMENAAGINTNGRVGDAVKSELNTDATMETNIDVVKSGSTVTKLVYEGYTVKGATQATTYGADTWAGRSKAGNTTQDNTLTLGDASKTYTNVYGGWTSGTGTKAAADKQNNSLNNTVNYTAGTLTGTLYGGYAANGEASGNTVNLGAIQTAANIYGGFGSVTKNNTINLKGARITGTVTGGSANGTGNTLAVYKPSEVQDFAGVQNLHFHTDELTAGTTTPLLKLGTTTKDIRGLNIGVDRSGDAPKLKKGDKLLLMKTAGSLTTDDKIENKIEGKQGMARRYTYEIKKENTGELTATVTHAGLGDDAKSPVETRAGLSNLVNQGADYIIENGMSAAETALRADAGAGSSAKSGKSAQRKTADTDNASYQLWAGVGANAMRLESGSYVDSKGWNLGVGWAREDTMKDGAKRLFSPFVEYGRGSYDSYLDNGTHGSGTISYLGIGILGKLTQQDGLWLEGSVRGGRATSDYQLHGSSDADYDGSNTYYGIHLGIGKTVELRKDAAIDAYARYFWSHQNGMSVKLSSGDDYDFASVDSHRLRLGFRYSQKDQHKGEFYTGLAWEYEFDGEARATIGGDAAPSPSLKGSSAMLELGYRFMPKNSRVSYDLHLNGWQGKRKGITGGASVKWAF